MTTRIVILTALLSVTLSACLTRPFSTRREVVRYGGEGVSSKIVMRKMDPNYLVALDNTSCEVSHDKYRRTREGQRATCHWRIGTVAGGRHGSSSAEGAPASAPAATDRAAQREQVLGSGTTRPTPRPGGN